MPAIIPSARLRFYPLLAIALVTFIVIGFSRTFYLRFLSDLPPMRAVMQVHGLVFTAWLALFVAQTQLIAAQRVDLHRKLGVAGILLALAVVATSILAMLVAAATPRINQIGLTAPQASILPVVAITQFVVLLTAGVALRHRASLHRRLMMLAMISVLAPPTARLIALLDLRQHFLLLQMSVVAVFVTICLVHDWRNHRILHPVFATGGIVLVSMWPLRYVIARSEMWQPIGGWFATVGRQLIF